MANRPKGRDAKPPIYGSLSYDSGVAELTSYKTSYTRLACRRPLWRWIEELEAWSRGGACK